MGIRPKSVAARPGLPLILIAAVAQGWALYGLHRAIAAHHWPATSLAWLVASYAAVLFVPTTMQLLAEHANRASFWVLTVLFGVAVFYFGWHSGQVTEGPVRQLADRSDVFVLACVLVVWWVHLLPFLQNRLAQGRWSTDYGRLFAYAWRDVITLSEAGIFTGLFWMLLGLWQTLFHMLGMDFFRTLFSRAMFIYPVTAIVFGCALHLIGSVEAMIATVLEQLLNVLKWLGTVAGLLLVLFTLALLVKLPGLVFSGRKAIGAEWLLWLVAVIVLFINAAYRDGSVERPYPRWIAQALRFAVPLTVIIAGTALYALIIRTNQYGLTVGRVWALVVAVAALVYAAGYSITAFRSGPWLGGISRVNVVVALGLIATVAAALTPLMSPYRLAAASQYRLILSGRYATPPGGTSPFTYLRFYSGDYGRQALQRLAQIEGRPDAAQIHGLATDALNRRDPWTSPVLTDAAPLIAKIPVYPTGKKLDPELARQLAADWRRLMGNDPQATMNLQMGGIFVDLRGDGSEDFVLVLPGDGAVYAKDSGHWQQVARLYSHGAWSPWPDVAAALAAGRYSTVEPQWKQLTIGGNQYGIGPK